MTTLKNLKMTTLNGKYFILIFPILVSCAQKKVKIFPIIDAHAHFHSKQQKNFNQPSQAILEEFQAAQVKGAVIHFSDAENFKAQVNRKGPIEWKTCMGLHPGDTVKKVEKGIQEGRFQCLKVYLGYVPLWATDRFYIPFYRLAEKHQIPVVFHTGDTYDKHAKVKYADPLQIDEVAVDFPKVKFVIAHMGNPWFDSAAEVVYKNDNVFVDVSALVLGDVNELSQPEKEELVKKPLHWFYTYVADPKKFLYGSDWPLLKQQPYIDLMKEIIPEKDWHLFFYQNAKDVFGFKVNNPKEP